jgi:rfaE bifunctional protein nucleotidyltransferase chain/domain
MRGAAPGREKRVTLEEAAAQARSARARGATVALANGVFDLFHVGHLRYLEAAATEADLLVVAVNSDASTRAYKGPDRPVIPEAERAEILCGLACVDLVVIFEERDAVRVLEALRPDVHAKGTDYTAETVPERAIVAGYGGRVVICGDPKDHSSTALIAALGAPGR